MRVHNYFLNHTANYNVFMHRILTSFIGMVLLTAVLIINIYNLQIINFDYYRMRSYKNCIRLIPIAPNRGTIFDRNGIPLAVNRTIYQLEIIPEKIVNIQQTLNNLRSIIDLNDDDINNFNRELEYSHFFSSIPIKTNLTEVQVARFSINNYRFPGVEVKGYRRRYYPYGSILTHVIGYVSKINNEDIENLNKNGQLMNYIATSDIGKLGIERYYENVLHGHIGYEKVEVNNRGKIIRQLKEISPQAGDDIYLTLDLRLQKYIEKLLSNSKAAVVVTDPHNGAILALVSTPSYDPNLFVNGISNRNYSILLNDPNMPLVNRATQGSYPPASTVKPYIAISALSTGIINRNTSFLDYGWWQLPGSDKRYHDWKKWGHGYLNVTKSLEESADTFFYQIAYDMGIDRLSEWMGKFGYGHYTGIDLAEEDAGNMPTREWKQKKFNKPWYQGDTIPVGIGQGYLTATPLQMNKALMILINNGVIKIPHLLKSIVKNGKHIPWVQLSHTSVSNIHSCYWEIAKDGMYGVANRSNGTAYKYFAKASYKVAVKSGTAQVFTLKDKETYNVHKIAKHLHDHKLMIAFAPYNNPQIAVSMILENGGSGLPIGIIMRQILDFFILKSEN